MVKLLKKDIDTILKAHPSFSREFIEQLYKGIKIIYSEYTVEVGTLLYNNHVDELIYNREQARLNKDWKLCDKIRNILDERGVFIFDTKEGQTIYYMGKYFNKSKDISDRKCLEILIKKDIDAEKRWESWLYSISKSAKLK